MPDEDCAICGSGQKVQQGHLMAPSKGGKATTPMCQKCVKSKGTKALMEWLRDLKDATKDTQKYRWNRIVDFQKGKRNDIAKKVQKIRDE